LVVGDQCRECRDIIERHLDATGSRAQRAALGSWAGGDPPRALQIESDSGIASALDTMLSSINPVGLTASLDVPVRSVSALTALVLVSCMRPNLQPDALTP
jgi:hypothetical protein